jgi:hypothetical protein
MVKKFIGSAGLEQSAHSGGIDLTTKGDIHGYSNTNARVPIGDNDQVLTADSGESLGLKWATPSAGGATVSSNDITGFTDGQTTTSTSLADPTGTSAATLANISGGFAMIVFSWVGEHDGTDLIRTGLHFNGADQLQTSSASPAGGNNWEQSLPVTDNLDGGVIQTRWAVSAGTGTLKNKTNYNTICAILEVG